MIGRLLIMYGVMFFLVEHLFADNISVHIIYKGGARSELSASTQGSMVVCPFSLDVKGGE